MTGAVEAQASQTQFSGVHADLTGLAADDHLQYALLAGRALGQTLIGGTGAGEVLALQGSANADHGQLNVNSSTIYDWDWTQHVGANLLRWNQTVPASGGVILSALSVANTISVNSGLFIISAVDDASNINWTVSPGFAVSTLFFARPIYRSINAGINPANASIFVAQAQFQSFGAGNITTAAYNGLQFGPNLRAVSAGDQMHLTAITGLRVSPVWNTNNATAVVDFGTIRGVHMITPVQQLFGASTGTETMANYIGLDMNSIGLATTGIRAVIRSALIPSAQNYFLLNNGGAESEFGFGDCHFNDGTWLKFGNTILDPDIIFGWQASEAAMAFSTFFGPIGGAALYLEPGVNDTWTFRGPAALEIGIGFNANAIAFGVAVPTPETQNWFVKFEGAGGRQVQSAGVYSDVWWTAGGLIDVNGLAVTEINSFRIDPNVTVLNGGSVLDQSGLFLAGMGFPGSGAADRIQSLRVTGRSRMDGHINQGSQSPAQITASVNNYQLGNSNAQRGVALLDSDDNWNITGIDSAINFGQGGDFIKLINVGAFILTLTHEDAASLAGNRFLRSNGLDLVLAPGETVEIWKDDTATDRWRIIEGVHYGAGLLSGPWSFSTSTVAADPGAGNLRYDNVLPASVTNIYIDRFTDSNGDAQNILTALANGDQLYIQQQGDAAAFIVFDITSVTDNVGWFTIGGTINASGDLPNNNRTVQVSARFA